RAYPHCPEALAATARVAEECALGDPPWGALVFPRFADLAIDGASGDGGGRAAGGAPGDSFALLEARCEEGARRRYGAVTPAVREVAKVYGLPDSEIARVAGGLSRYWGAGTALEATARSPLFRGAEFDPK